MDCNSSRLLFEGAKVTTSSPVAVCSKTPAETMSSVPSGLPGDSVARLITCGMSPFEAQRIVPVPRSTPAARSSTPAFWY